jgi:hypothetical protein
MSLGTFTLAWLLLVSGATPGEITYFNKQNFKIPLEIDPARRPEIKELQLCVSDDLGLTYHQDATASPEQDGFPYFAKSDGQYWFTVVVVDPQGQRQPTDPKSAPPGQKIVVDTKPPSLSILSAERQGEDVMISWQAQDENLDLSTLKLEWRPSDSVELAPWFSQPILSPTASGQMRFRPTASKALTLRMEVQDLAKNKVAAQKDVPAVAGLPVASAAPTTLPAAGPGPAPLPTQPAISAVNPSQTQLPGYTEERVVNSAPRSDAWNQQPQQFPPQAANSVYMPPPPPPSSGPIQRVVAESRPGAFAPAVAPLGALPNAVSMTPFQIINKKQLALDYEVTEGGRSKLLKVEVYVSQDNGQSWHPLCEDPDLQSPVLVDLPREGIYGLKLVLTSGAGLSYGPPQPGDRPDMIVQIDLTPPEAQLYEPKPDPQRPSILVITWNARDNIQLTPNPISLGWAENSNGPWNPIGPVAMANTGRYDWQLPENLPHQVYMRLIARDTAGNLGEATTPSAVLVDLQKPRGILKGISSSTLSAARQP